VIAALRGESTEGRTKELIKSRRGNQGKSEDHPHEKKSRWSKGLRGGGGGGGGGGGEGGQTTRRVRPIAPKAHDVGEFVGSVPQEVGEGREETFWVP